MSDDWQIILLISLVVLAVFVGLGLFFFFKKKKEKEKNNEFPELLEALGGAENIDKVELSGSRINLFLINKKSMDKEKVKENGVSAIVVTSKKITLVIGRQSSLVFNYLKQNLA